LESRSIRINGIVTNYAGHTEFCTPDNSFLLNVIEMEDAYDGKWFKPGMNANQGQWAVPDEEQLIELMRIYPKHQDIVQSRVNGAFQTAERLTWSNCAKRLSDVTGI
jgi:hypothetical protein